MKIDPIIERILKKSRMKKAANKKITNWEPYWNSKTREEILNKFSERQARIIFQSLIEKKPEAIKLFNKIKKFLKSKKFNN